MKNKDYFDLQIDRAARAVQKKLLIISFHFYSS